MSSNGRADKMMVQLSGIAREGNSQFKQIKQDGHVEWDEADAINRWLLMEVFFSVKPNISTLIVACLRRDSDACGREDTTNPQREGLDIHHSHQVEELDFPRHFWTEQMEKIINRFDLL